MTKPKAKSSVTKIVTPMASKDKSNKTAAVKKLPVKVVAPVTNKAPVAKKVSMPVQPQSKKPVTPPQVKASVPIKPISKPVKPETISIKELFQSALSNPPKVDNPIVQITPATTGMPKKDKLSFSEVFPLRR